MPKDLYVEFIVKATHLGKKVLQFDNIKYSLKRSYYMPYVPWPSKDKEGQKIQVSLFLVHSTLYTLMNDQIYLTFGKKIFSCFCIFIGRAVGGK